MYQNKQAIVVDYIKYIYTQNTRTQKDLHVEYKQSSAKVADYVKQAYNKVSSDQT